MSDHLFGSITLPPELHQLVEFHRFHLDRGAGFASTFDGWQALLGHLRGVGPMAFLASACEHLEHFGDDAAGAIDELMDSPSNVVVALGIAMQSLVAGAGSASRTTEVAQPRWLTDIEARRAVQASVRDESPHRGPTPWIIELDFGGATTSCINVWINLDGSPYQLFPSDEPIEEVEAFLGDINHLVPNRAFSRVPPAEALAALFAPAHHPGTTVGDRAMLQWLLRTTPTPTP